MRKITLSILMAVAFGSAAPGQEFEAVSVKPNKSMSGSSRSSSDQGLYTATNLSLKNLVMIAYDMKDYQVEGPDWLASERFDVKARFPGDLPKEREKFQAALMAMMQRMLADRFNLTVHRDQKTFSVYGLTVGKGGPKFKEVSGGDSHSNGGDTHYQGTAVTMVKLAEFLSRRMDLPVLDMTGLKGVYDVTLDWAPEPAPSSKGNEPTTIAGLALPEAIQDQLGLKLENRKAPIGVLIVDHAEKAPTEN